MDPLKLNEDCNAKISLEDYFPCDICAKLVRFRFKSSRLGKTVVLCYSCAANETV